MIRQILCFISSNVVLVSAAFADDAPAVAATGAAQPGPMDALSGMLPLFAMLFFIFYVLVFKPQQKKLKEQQDLLSSIKKGDSAVTSSGIMGRVAGVEPDHILLEIAPNVKVKFEKSHLVKRIEKEATTEKAA